MQPGADAPKMVLDVHPKLEFLYAPAAYKEQHNGLGRFKVLHGGRGGLKSWGVARTLIQKAYSMPS
jgi:hypothetical protein